MKKVVLNCSANGFSLSKDAVIAILNRKGITINKIETNQHGGFLIKTNNKDCYYTCSFMSSRDDIDLIAIVEKLGREANGNGADLFIEEYDDENYEHIIINDCGEEYLELTPVVTQDKLEPCSSTVDVMKYLQSIGIKVKKSNKGV